MKPRKKVLEDYTLTGECTVNIPELLKDWNNQYTILKYHQKYTLIKYRKGAKNGSTTLKVQIPEEQALKIIKDLQLGEIKDTTFTYASSFKSKDFIQSEVNRLQTIYNERYKELNITREILDSYRLATFIYK